MTHHRSWRERIGGHSEHGPEPDFEMSEDSILLAFARLFVTSELVSLDANKQLRTDAFSPLYDCETESVRVEGGTPEQFVAIWTPVWDGTDPLTGFRTGRDSAYLGSTLPVAMPEDERTAALLLLVTSDYIHLSGGSNDSRGQGGSALLIRGAVDEGGEQFRFVELTTAATVQVTTAASSPAEASVETVAPARHQSS
ncbi:MAG: hypothetical protein JWN95_1841 [Frankiales bacterium]|nr:hypothetical protein [Frankiales bacterium]